MLKFVQSFPQIRLAIYGAASLILAGLVLAGILTEGQSGNILTYVAMGLGSVATLLAGLNVTKTPATSTVFVGGTQLPTVNDVISQGIAAANQVQSNLAPTVDQIRAQLELQLGSRRTG
ncbi:hypothetical protein MTX36_22690 [Rhodococcus sp. ARC_M6]|nr:hypothetical protein [Rhodococcus sp. ARC_M6]